VIEKRKALTESTLIPPSFKSPLDTLTGIVIIIIIVEK
jgi:hypothetical protein